MSLTTTRLIQFSKLLRKILFFKVIREQRDAASKLLLSSILWDTFTGSASYLDIFKRAVSPVLFISFIKSFIMGLFNIRSKNKPFTISKSLSDFGLAFQNGETIVNQGEVGNCMYVIQEGEVEIVKSEKDKEIRLDNLK